MLEAIYINKNPRYAQYINRFRSNIFRLSIQEVVDLRAT